MSFSFRSGILATFSIVLLLLSSSANALSCAMRIFTLAEAYEKADSIVVGLVTECAQPESADRWAGGGDQCVFVTLEALKESIPTRDYAGVANSSGCGLSLHVGEQYLLFLDKQNQPLWYSESLRGNAWTTRLTEQRIGILRDFRDGLAADLSEPWISHESTFGGCTLTHSVNGRQIAFSIRPLDAVPMEEIEWSQIVVNGRPLLTAEQASEIKRQIRENPERSPRNLQVMTVNLREQSPTVPRNATIRIGNRSWPLDRDEITWDEDGGMTEPDTTYHYSVKGDIAEEILHALETPSDVVVAATLVSPATNSGTRIDSTSSSRTKSENQTKAVDSFFGSAVPANTAAAGIESELQTTSRRAYPREPEPVIRIDTRSTNLPRAIDEYRSCYRTNE